MARFSALGAQWESSGDCHWDAFGCLCSVVDDFQKVRDVFVVVDFSNYQMSIESSVDVSVCGVDLVGGDEG